jgi:hypothetical protein
VLFSLVYVPELGPHGAWVQVWGETVKCGPDDPRIPAAECLAGIAPVDPRRRPDSTNIYLIGFQQHDPRKADAVSQAGLTGYAPDDMPGSIYPLLATGEFAGSLIHSPNIYDFPVSLHIARVLGGDAVWVASGERVNFRETWLDERADMLRLPGIVACAVDRRTLQTLCDLSRDWNPDRYAR